MKAPDKIYVEICEDGIFAFPEPPFEETPAYIRKDALLEWAKETYLNENASAISKVCYKQLIDKIESL